MTTLPNANIPDQPVKDKQDTQSDKEFWNAKADTFPRFSKGDNTYEDRMLSLVTDLGVDFHAKSVLDVGCGTGMYTIHIAMQAARIFALDISDKMLCIFKEDAAAQGLANIEFILSDWMEYAPLPDCDLVFCSMSAAIKDDASREKLLHCRGATVIFMSFVWRKPSDVMEGLYRHFLITPKNFNNSPIMREWLENRDLPYGSRRLEDKWDVRWESQALIDSCALTLRRHGVEPDPDFLTRHVETFRREDGSCHEITKFCAEVLVWQNPA